MKIRGIVPTTGAGGVISLDAVWAAASRSAAHVVSLGGTWISILEFYGASEEPTPDACYPSSLTVALSQLSGHFLAHQAPNRLVGAEVWAVLSRACPVLDTGFTRRRRNPGVVG